MEAPKPKFIAIDDGSCISAINHLLEHCSPEALLEFSDVARLHAAKAGHTIAVRCWTPSNGRATTMHATSIEDAYEILKTHAKFHANFELRFESEKDPEVAA